MSRKNSDSHLYQYKYAEVSVDMQQLINYRNEDGIQYSIQTKEELQDCQQELMSIIRDLVKKIMTPHQKKIINLLFDGMSQADIGKQLGICQPAVHKAIHGNVDYKRKDEKGNNIRYGGIVLKIQKACKNNARVQELLATIERLRGED